MLAIASRLTGGSYCGITSKRSQVLALHRNKASISISVLNIMRIDACLVLEQCSSRGEMMATLVEAKASQESSEKQFCRSATTQLKATE
jgi:hypothetical protein